MFSVIFWFGIKGMNVDKIGIESKIEQGEPDSKFPCNSYCRKAFSRFVKIRLNPFQAVNGAISAAENNQVVAKCWCGIDGSAGVTGVNKVFVRFINRKDIIPERIVRLIIFEMVLVVTIGGKGPLDRSGFHVNAVKFSAQRSHIPVRC